MSETNEVTREIKASEEKMKMSETNEVTREIKMSEEKMNGIYDVIADKNLTGEEKVVFIAAMSSGQVVGPIVKKTQYIVNYHVYEIRDGKLVDVDPPTVLDGTKYWKNILGQVHRDDDLPAKIDKYGNLWWYQNGKVSRIGDKPSLEYIDGTLKWHNGENFTLIKFADGSERYYTDDGKIKKVTAAIYPTTYYYNSNGNFHNTDEPTIINGKKIWYTDNVPTRIE